VREDQQTVADPRAAALAAPRATAEPHDEAGESKNAPSGARAVVKDAVCGFYKYTGLMHAQERLAYRRGRRAVAILLFHRVTDAIPRDGLTVGTDWFRGLCRVLRDRFHVVSLGDVPGLLKSGAIPPRTVAITFDDCYYDNLPAARVLAEHGLPACFFIPTRFVGTDHVFPWDAHLARMPNLTWDDVRELVALGHEIGSHTVSHADLGRIDSLDARRELVESRDVLEKQLGRPVRWLAYPFGSKDNFRPEYLPLAYDVGYEACFSGFGGSAHPQHLGGVLPREPVPCFHSLLSLEVHLTGCLNWWYRAKRVAAAGYRGPAVKPG
jgi:peptidoglycan/xylan/chitin deacetylase (PgdA/CDA1 family)